MWWNRGTGCVHPTNLHQLQDAILPIWANISKECFQDLVKSMPLRIKAVLKAKEVKHSFDMVFLIILSVSVYIYMESHYNYILLAPQEIHE